MIKAIRAALNEFAAIAEVRAAEIRTGITLIEAVAADEFETQLLAISGSTDAADRARAVAIRAAISGISPEEADGAIRQWLATGWKVPRD